MSRIGEIENSKDFLEECTYQIGLNCKKNLYMDLTLMLELYNVKETCSYYEKMEYSPVLIEIVSKEIKANFKANYLL